MSGFLWWAYTFNRDARTKRKEAAKSGALRLLLRILRSSHGNSWSLEDLATEFSSPENEGLRRGYCGRNFLFETEAEFEAAIYQLDWEGKIDFVSQKDVAFRVDQVNDREVRLPDLIDNAPALLQIFEDSLGDETFSTWDVERIARACAKLSPTETTGMIQRALASTDQRVRIRAASILERLV